MNYEDHCIGLGKLWGDLQGLEVTLRIFLTHCSTTYQSMSQGVADINDTRNNGIK